MMEMLIGSHQQFGGVAKAYRMLIGEGAPSVEQEIGYDATNKQMQFHDGTAVRRFLTDADLISVHPDSAGYLEILNNQVRLKSLAISTVTVDATSADIIAFAAASYSAGTELQEGDTVILTTPAEAWIHNGGTAGTSADFTLIETPGVSASATRAMFTGVNGITYNATTGEFKLGGTLTENTSLSGGGSFNFTVVSVPQISVSATQSASLTATNQVNLGAAELQISSSAGNGFTLTGGQTLHYGNSAGIQYVGMVNYDGLLNDSLVPKSWVLSRTGSGVKKYAETLELVAGTKVTVVHGLALANAADALTKISIGGSELAVQVSAVDANTVEFTPLVSAASARVVVYGV